MAKDLWQTGDVLATRQALDGWDDQDLAELLGTMLGQAPDFETRQSLTALVQMLKLPDHDVSSFSSLLGQKTIILSAFLSLSPVLLAVALIVTPMVRDRARQSDGLLGRLASSRIEEATGAPGVIMDESGQYGEALDMDQEIGADEAEDQMDEAGGDIIGAGGYEDEEEDEDEDDWWEEDDEEEGGDASVGDILMSLFEEEDSELPQLEAIAKDLPDLEIGDLMQTGQDVAGRLERGNTLRTRAQRKQG